MSGFRYFREKIHSTQMCMLLKPVFSRHEGDWVQITDEPTGNLDKKTAQETLELLIESAKKFGQTLIIVTHDLEVARMSEAVITIEDGRVIS